MYIYLCTCMYVWPHVCVVHVGTRVRVHMLYSTGGTCHVHKKILFAIFRLIFCTHATTGIRAVFLELLHVREIRDQHSSSTVVVVRVPVPVVQL